MSLRQRIILTHLFFQKMLFIDVSDNVMHSGDCKVEGSVEIFLVILLEEIPSVEGKCHLISLHKIYILLKNTRTTHTHMHLPAAFAIPMQDKSYNTTFFLKVCVL